MQRKIGGGGRRPAAAIFLAERTVEFARRGVREPIQMCAMNVRSSLHAAMLFSRTYNNKRARTQSVRGLRLNSPPLPTRGKLAVADGPAISSGTHGK